MPALIFQRSSRDTLQPEVHLVAVRGCAMTEGSVEISTNRRGEFRTRGHGGLRAALLAAGVVVMLVGLYARVLPLWLEDLWDDPNYSHVFIVPIISGFVLWQRRRDLAAQSIRGSWRGLPLLLAGAGALILGDIGDETFLMRTSLIVILVGLVLLNLGSGSSG